MTIINILPIKWFGDKNAYMNSPVRIISVGLNPSDKEFREKDGEPYSSRLRFPDYIIGDDVSLENALNNYFEKNPYRKWFNAGFEPLLNGMNASFYSCDAFKNRAIHTDICSPWATDPTWMNLLLKDRRKMFEEGFQLWKDLVKELSPDIILFSIPNEYVKNLLIGGISELCQISTTKDGKQRKSPIIIRKGTYGKAIAVFGKTRNVPFGSLGKEQKKELGKIIQEFYHS